MNYRTPYFTRYFRLHTSGFVPRFLRVPRDVRPSFIGCRLRITSCWWLQWWRLRRRRACFRAVLLLSSTERVCASTSRRASAVPSTSSRLCVASSGSTNPSTSWRTTTSRSSIRNTVSKQRSVVILFKYNFLKFRGFNQMWFPFQNLLSTISSWNFNVFTLDKLTNGMFKTFPQIPAP